MLKIVQIQDFTFYTVVCGSYIMCSLDPGYITRSISSWYNTEKCRKLGMMISHFLPVSLLFLSFLIPSGSGGVVSHTVR